MKKKILITGANGQLGSEIKRLSKNFQDYTFFFTAKSDLDVTNKEMVSNYIVERKINVIINCAGYTAVDRAESEPELADKINHLAVGYLGQIAQRLGVQLIHISTDYVFDGLGVKPYTVNDPTAPINVYGETKLAGEIALKEIGAEGTVIIRTSWLYSSFGNNFVKNILKSGEEKQNLKVVNDQVGTPTYAGDLAYFVLKHAVGKHHEGVKIYHYSNEGSCSWYEFAKNIIKIGNKVCRIQPISTSEYPTAAKRPLYSLLDKEITKKHFNVEIPSWEDSLKECVELLK